MNRAISVSFLLAVLFALSACSTGSSALEESESSVSPVDQAIAQAKAERAESFNEIRHAQRAAVDVATDTSTKTTVASKAIERAKETVRHTKSQIKTERFAQKAKRHADSTHRRAVQSVTSQLRAEQARTSKKGKVVVADALKEAVSDTEGVSLK